MVTYRLTETELVLSSFSRYRSYIKLFSHVYLIHWYREKLYESDNARHELRKTERSSRSYFTVTEIFPLYIKKSDESKGEDVQKIRTYSILLYSINKITLLFKQQHAALAIMYNYISEKVKVNNVTD